MKTIKVISEEIVQWLKDYAEKNDRKAFVVGVSGGVDSALVSTLCAMTGIHTNVVILPCQSKSDGIERANKHIGWLHQNFKNVTKHEIDLTPTFETFVKSTEMYRNDLADVNTKSRLRMIALYQIATPLNGLVVGTGNKIEDFGIGFFTKYGDGGVDISPIGDLLKSEVRKMSKELGILPELVWAIPTDGLWSDNRTDEQAIGATYDDLEFAMNYIEENTDPVHRDFVTMEQNMILNLYVKLNKRAQHKLNPIPVFKKTKN